MKLAAIKCQLSTLEKRLNAVQGKGKAVEYVWTVVGSDGIKRVTAGNPHSMAQTIVEIAVVDADGPTAAPRLYIDGVEHSINEVPGYG